MTNNIVRVTGDVDPDRAARKADAMHEAAAKKIDDRRQYYADRRARRK